RAVGPLFPEAAGDRDRRRARPLADHLLAAFEALLRPHLARPVIGLEGRHVAGQRHPGQLRAGIDMHRRLDRGRVVEAADADKAELRQAAILAPHRDPAARAAMDVVRPAAIGRHRVGDRRAGEDRHPVGLDHGVDSKGRAGLPLAILAVAAMDEHRRALQPVPHRAAGASAFERAGHRNYSRYDTIAVIGTSILARPPRNSSSMMQAPAATRPPWRETRSIAARIVPPVASKSSTMTTRCPGAMASSCTSIVSVPYSSA